MPFTTEAYVLEKVNSDFKLETIELDDPQDEEVLVEGGLRWVSVKEYVHANYVGLQWSPVDFVTVSLPCTSMAETRAIPTFHNALVTVYAGHIIPTDAAARIIADLLIANGAFPSPFPNIVGHEGSGKVVKVGKAVTRVKEGDSVLLSFSYDQKCKTCRGGHPAACKVRGCSH